MATKKPNPFLEKMEGKAEKGKPLPVKTVRGKKTPPLMKNKKVTVPNDKKSRPSPGNGDKMCPPCKRSGASSCSHM